MGEGNTDKTSAPDYSQALDFSWYGRSRSARWDDFNSLNYGNYPFETRWFQRRVAIRRARKRMEREKGGGRGKKWETRGKLVQLISRFPAENSIFVSDEVSKGRDANIARALWLITLSRMRINPRAEGAQPLVYACTCICVYVSSQSTWLDVIARGYIVSDEAEGCPSVA